MRSAIRNHEGFTLIELMIVVVIIGILAALAVPRFMAANVRAKQSEAKGILKEIYTMQQAYRQEFNGYWGDGLIASRAAPLAFGRIHVEIMPSALYTYTMASTISTFSCVATCGVLDDDATIDSWTIDDTGVMITISDDSVL